jgi:hypothetical protein
MSGPRHCSSSIASLIGGLSTSSSSQTTQNTVADSSAGEEELVQTQFEKYASEAAEGHTEEDFQSRKSKLVEARAELDRIKEALEARMLHGMDLGNELIPHLIYLLDITAWQAVAVGPGSYFEKSTSEMTRILV